MLTFAPLNEVINGRGNKSSLFYFIDLEVFFIEEQINHWLAAKFQEEDFADCFLVELEFHKNNKLEVFVDCESGLSLDKCRRISRYLEGCIEEKNMLGEKYTLEVSSPGLSKPLKLNRQYKKNIGRQLEVTLEDGTEKIGELKSVTDLEITLEENVVVREGKKKKKMVLQTALPFEQIKKALVVISFKG